MGICVSHDVTSDATSKLILEDGELVEYSYPVRVSFLLQQNPNCFICNSDEMEFDDQLLAVDENEELQPGQLYFVLPLNKLRYSLQPEEMAALAVKASSALMKNGSGVAGGNRKQVAPVNFIVSDQRIPRRETETKSRSVVAEKRSRSKCGGRGRNFTSKLGAIPE